MVRSNFSKKLKNIPYSLSESIDRSKKMKVIMIRCAFKAQFEEVHKVMFPNQSLWLSIKEDTLSDLTKYDTFIDTFNEKYKQ